MAINNYYCDELSTWKPSEKVEIVHSMEVLYYFKNPLVVLKNIYDNWLKENGKFIMGIDFYFENHHFTRLARKNQCFHNDTFAHKRMEEFIY
jgi:hypothetical protein